MSVTSNIHAKRRLCLGLALERTYFTDFSALSLKLVSPDLIWESPSTW
jgi:hypothetical protein